MMVHQGPPGDVLWDIETAVALLDEELPDLSDWDVFNAYESLRRLYHSADTGHGGFSLRPMSPLAQRVFAVARSVCEQRVERAEVRAACFRQLRRSLRSRTQSAGRRGYLEFLCRERGRGAS